MRGRDPLPTLRARLVTLLVAVVVTAALVIGVVSAVGLRTSLVHSLDATLVEAAGRGARAGGDGGSDEGGPGTGARRAPPGLLAPGQDVGTVMLSATGLGDGSLVVAGAHLDADGTSHDLDADQARALLAGTTTSAPATVDVPGLGAHRALAARTGDTVLITALPLTEADALTLRYLVVEALVLVLAVATAVLAGRRLVRRELAPLERLAGVAGRVAATPLHTGEVVLAERVAAADLAGTREVAQVGTALDALLGNVEESLTARQASETKLRRFVADASHELRTPLASVRGYAELVRRRGDDLPPEAAHALGRIEAESTRMTGLVEDLLLLARLDAGRTLREDEVDLVPLVIDAVGDAHTLAPGHRWLVDLPVVDDLDDPAGATQVRGDEARLRQVLTNLLTNARGHTPTGTTVSTRVRRDGTTVVLTVEDDGPGVGRDLLPRLFDRFTRGEDSRARLGDGTTGESAGLGMSIVRAVVDAHGGSVAAADVDPHGLRVTVRLPATP